MKIWPLRFDLPALAAPLSLAAGGLYAIHALDLLHDERHGMASHPGRVEGGELLLWGAAMLLMLGWHLLHAHNVRRAEQARARAAQARAEMLGHADPLTGIANRRTAEEQLRLLLAAPLAAGTRITVVLLELDGVQPIRDAHGPAIGDAVLKVVARRLEAAVRITDLAARLEGERFVVLLPEVADAVAAETVARRICVAIEAPIELDGRRHGVRATLGIAMEGDDGRLDADELLRRAEGALRTATAAGRGLWHFHAAAAPEAATA